MCANTDNMHSTLRCNYNNYIYNLNHVQTRNAAPTTTALTAPHKSCADLTNLYCCYQIIPKSATADAINNKNMTSINNLLNKSIFKQQQQQHQQHETNLNCHLTNSLIAAITRPDCHTLLLPFHRSMRRLLLRLLLLLLIIMHLPSTLAAPQSCIYCREEDLKAKDPQHNSKNYEEFLFEHQVTRKDAINSLKTLNETFYLGPSPESSCKSVVCTKKVMNYCLGPQFINDHCWCELGHTDEGLPFVPHICYVGEKTYKASVGSCFFYEEVKECCCAPALATQWRHISGTTTTTTTTPQHLLVCLLSFLYSAGHSYFNRNGLLT